MKLGFNPSPNYHCGSSTKQIMKELTLALAAVYVFAIGYQAVAHGMGNALHVVLMTLVSVATALIVEYAWGKFVVKTEPVSYIKKSFGWVTALILVLMLPANTAIYPVVIGTLFAIVIVKLLFGGFGTNIFNPAAAGCAVIFSYFATSKVADVVTSATPTSTISASYHWVITDAADVTAFLSKFNGLGGMLMGTYDGAIGETCALLLVVLGVVLAIRKVIDWRVPVFYVGTVFVLAAIYGLCVGAGMWYPVFHVLTGGLMFGAVFMATDPVTNPTSNQGRIVFAIGCGILTVLIRVKGNLSEGVLYSILLMNMLTPWIERACAGVSYKTVKKSTILVCATALVGALLMPVCAMAYEPVEKEEPTPTPAPTPTAVELNLSDSYDKNAAVVTGTVENGDVVVYTVETAGFSGEAAKNVVEVSINKTTRAIESVVVTTFSDTQHVGDAACAEDYLSVYAGKSVDASVTVDAKSGATVTSTSIAAAVHAAAVAFDETCTMAGAGAGEQGGEEAPSYGLPFNGTYDSCNATVTATAADGGKTTYTVTANGFPGNNANVFTVVVDDATKTVVSVEFAEFNDTPGIGDAANNETFLSSFAGQGVDGGVDAVSGATYTSTAAAAAVVAALNN